MKVYIGCSGYHYDSWKDKFYDPALPKTKWLEFYARHFNTLEVNNSFYRLPKKETFRRWYEHTPDDFIFTVKGSQFITHRKKIKVDEMLMDGLGKLYDVAAVLEEKLGCILWQLPGNLKYKRERLERFCSAVDHAFRNVLEFRDISWFNEEAYSIMRQYGVGYCALSAPDNLPEDLRLTSSFAYLRFHGKNQWYHYLYHEEELSHWKDSIAQLTPQPEELYAYFNNDVDANAVKNAQQLAEML